MKPRRRLPCRRSCPCTGDQTPTAGTLMNFFHRRLTLVQRDQRSILMKIDVQGWSAAQNPTRHREEAATDVLLRRVQDAIQEGSRLHHVRAPAIPEDLSRSVRDGLAVVVKDATASMMIESPSLQHALRGRDRPRT